jgi:hypothetical protein
MKSFKALIYFPESEKAMIALYGTIKIHMISVIAVSNSFYKVLSQKR